MPANVFWEVAGAVQVGTTAHLEGTVLGQTAINLETGASINGRLLAQTAVSIAGSTVTAALPAPWSASPRPKPTKFFRSSTAGPN